MCQCVLGINLCLYLPLILLEDILVYHNLVLVLTNPTSIMSLFLATLPLLSDTFFVRTFLSDPDTANSVRQKTWRRIAHISAKYGWTGNVTVREVFPQ